MKTTDLYDAYEDALTLAQVGHYKRYGSQHEFGGEIITVRCFEDNTKAKKLLETDADGRILVIDGGGSYGRALMGDNVAAIAVSNGWAGVVVNGYIRDSVDIDKLPIGVLALGATPRRPLKQDDGNVGEPLHFAGVTFKSGHYLYADEDGLVLSPTALTL